ncbi:MAG TPA: MarR family transcriptional regulator [Planctomycetota bacterium]|nr:MarR family transcriptional regulator [Planctomycetota bacterium]
MSVMEDLDLERRADRIDEVLAYNLAELYARGFARTSEYLGRAGLSPAKWNVLLTARYVGGEEGLPQNRLAELLIVSGGNVTGLIDGLEDMGLVERAARPGDRRVRVVRATRKGRELIDELWPGYLKVLVEFASPLSSGQKRQAAGLLELWRKGVRRMNGKGGIGAVRRGKRAAAGRNGK